MTKKIGEMYATNFMKFEFEYDDKQLKKEAIIVRAFWWNSYHGDWESSEEKILIPLDKLDDFVNILMKVKGS